jgi:hypothetical protein
MDESPDFDNASDHDIALPVRLCGSAVTKNHCSSSAPGARQSARTVPMPLVGRSVGALGIKTKTPCRIACFVIQYVCFVTQPLGHFDDPRRPRHWPVGCFFAIGRYLIIVSAVRMAAQRAVV